PRQLTQIISNKFAGDDADQFRRVIRYMKRWKDFLFPNQGAAAPTGIALTACALNWFQPQKTSTWDYSASTNRVVYDDLAATTVLVERMRGAFRQVYNQGVLISALEVQLPVPPGNDLFGKMSGQQMQEFYRRLETLLGTLRGAKLQDEATACANLRRV